MRETAFPRWQFALVCLFVLGDALYLPAQPRQLWIQLPCAGLIAALIALLLCHLLKKFDPLALHGLVGRLLAAFLALLAARQALFEITRLCIFWKETAFRSLPSIVTALLLLAAGLRLARAGTVHLCMWALPTLCAVLTPLFLSILLTVPDWSLHELMPLTPQSGFVPGLLDCLLRYFLPALFPFLLLLGREQPGGSAADGIFAAAAVLGATSARNLLLLGAHTATYVRYPTFAAAGLVSVGDFFQRAEVLISGCLTLCQLARLAVLFLVVARGLRTAFHGLPLTRASSPPPIA